MKSNRVFCFDMDGTICGLYDVENWLEYLRSYNPTPYEVAAPLFNFSTLARQLNAAQRKGAKLVIVSWSSKESTPEFDRMVEVAKKMWLAAHLPSVKWDAIHVVPYGTSKSEVCGATNSNVFLFDDDTNVRNEWNAAGGLAFRPEDISMVLGSFNKVWRE